MQESAGVNTLLVYSHTYYKVMTVDVYGRTGEVPCWNHPDYRNWWLATVEDLFRSYELDGFQWGAERVGPLSNFLYRGTTPYCSCPHCRSRCRDRGIDVERAREGLRELHDFVQGLYRAEWSYAEMARTCDFIKPILYHDIAGPRLRHWYLDRLQKTILSELSLEQSTELFYALKGYDRTAEPRVDELERRGFTPDYVYRETKRCVEAVAGKAKVYAGIGIDIPWNYQERVPSDPENVYGAEGLRSGRERGSRFPGVRRDAPSWTPGLPSRGPRVPRQRLIGMSGNDPSHPRRRER